MRFSSLVSSLLASSTFTSALPATSPPPTALTQVTADNTNGSSKYDTTSHVPPHIVQPTLTHIPSSPMPNPFDRRFQVPDTSTVLWIAQGRPVNHHSLSILIHRAQIDVDDLIHRFGPQAVPGSIHAPKYGYQTRTPAGLEGYFFISAMATGGLTYQLVQDALSGLRIFLLEQGRDEQVVFEAEGSHGMEAFGGLSIGTGAEAGIRSMRNRTEEADESISSDPVDINLRCVFARPLPPAAIAQLLHLAGAEAASNIREQGPDGSVPGAAAAGGPWRKRGDLGAELEILGVPPRRLTWRLMAVAVARLEAVLVMGHVPREAQCSMITVGGEVVGVVLVRRRGTAAGFGPMRKRV
ncbi:MAG: hypothetical protein Q9196_006042, partial [Gyalolechia fulgens]